MSNYIFITGTNTDVGKTYFGTSLIQYLNQYKICIPFKPIETGCKRLKNELIPADSYKYFSHIKSEITLEEINPYRFEDPVSPYLAIRKAKRRIYLDDYYKKLKIISNKKNTILIEGAGGAFSPFALDGLNIDFMKLVRSKNILVVKDELGCIGSALSHFYAFKKNKVPLDIMILNNHIKNKMDNLNEIKKYVDIPIYAFGETTKDNIKCFVAIKNKILAK